MRYAVTKLFPRKVQIDNAYHISRIIDLIALEIDIESLSGSAVSMRRPRGCIRSLVFHHRPERK